MKTEKIFYKKPYLICCEAKVIEKTNEGVIFDKTIAYPEGGGQIGDSGVLIRKKTGEKIVFFNTTKIKGRNIFLENFPNIKVENLIVQHIDSTLLEDIELNEEFFIKIDYLKRAKITLNHSAIHLALMVLESIRGGIDKKIIGAKITETYARLDFSTDTKFSKEELNKIETTCNELISKQIPIYIYPHEKEPEALFWKCLNYIIPCGGTHCENTKYLNKVFIKRKNLGKNSERLVVEVKGQEEFFNLYGENNE